MAEDMAMHLSDSKFDSTVLANDSTTVFMTFLAPHAAARRSAIQTFIDYHEGPGVQHIALKSDDIFATVREMRARSSIGGMEFMPGASEEYYRCVCELWLHNLSLGCQEPHSVLPAGHHKSWQTRLNSSARLCCAHGPCCKCALPRTEVWQLLPYAVSDSTGEHSTEQ
jgi:hypothetical protein